MAVALANPEPASRKQNVEVLRILAAFGIVLFHAGGDYAQIGYSGLVIFLFLAPFFDACEWDRRRNIMSLALRLLLPWAAFMVLYGALNFLTKGWIISPDLQVWEAILYGTSPHLWFLPFIFVVLCAVALGKQLSAPNQVAIAAIFGLLAMTILTAQWRAAGSAAGPPLAQWLHALPAVLAGVALGAATAGRKLLWLSVLSILLVAAIAIIQQDPGFAVPYGLALPLVLLAIYLPQVKFSVEKLSRSMMGVYLVHIIALAVVGIFMEKTSLLAAAVAFIASLIGVVIARKVFPATRYILG